MDYYKMQDGLSNDSKAPSLILYAMSHFVHPWHIPNNVPKSERLGCGERQHGEKQSTSPDRSGARSSLTETALEARTVEMAGLSAAIER